MCLSLPGFDALSIRPEELDGCPAHHVDLHRDKEVLGGPEVLDLLVTLNAKPQGRSLTGAIADHLKQKKMQGSTKRILHNIGRTSEISPNTLLQL